MQYIDRKLYPQNAYFNKSKSKPNVNPKKWEKRTHKPKEYHKRKELMKMRAKRNEINRDQQNQKLDF